MQYAFHAPCDTITETENAPTAASYLPTPLGRPMTMKKQQYHNYWGVEAHMT